MNVFKKRGTEEFNIEKIKKAIELAEGRCTTKLSELDKNSVVSGILKEVYTEQFIHGITVADIHDIVIKVLRVYNTEVSDEYARYRNYKQKFNKTFLNIVQDTDRILSNGDKENANKDSQLNSTKKELVSGVVSEKMALDYEFNPEWSEAHKECALQIHDLKDWIYGSVNCCLFDMASLLKDGFEINGIKKKEPNSIKTALSIVSDVIMSASSQQFGGFTVPEIDSILAPYVRKSYDKYIKMMNDKKVPMAWKEIMEWVDELVYQDILQGIESIEHRLNTINNANGQTSFTTFSFGLDTTPEGRLITKALLEVRQKGLGETGVTAVFPKFVYLVRDEINKNEDSPNHDLYNKAIEVSLTRMYPDYLSLNTGYLGEVYEKYGKVISPMGCRSFLSVWENEKGEGVFTGRANCGVISLNLPQYALRSNGNINEFYNLVHHYLDMAIQIHLYKYAKLSKQKASSNPLFFTQGGCHMKLNPEDTIEEAIKTFTWSIGYIGLDEVTRYFKGVGLHEEQQLASDIITFLNDMIEVYKKQHGLLFSLYSTPAESMCYRFLVADRNKFGVVEGVTDKEYYTNSYHVQVREKVNAIHKQNIESEFFHKVTGGRIVYNEFPHTKNHVAVRQVINHAMDLGLYYGVNIALDLCEDCGHSGHFKDYVCTKCGSKELIMINRTCGYLSYKKLKGDTRFNKGKETEINERVTHFN